MQPEASKPKRTRRRVAAAVAIAVVALLSTAKFALTPKNYDVVSIKDAPAYQDQALLARAWSLPVAATYGPEALQYQTKASFCGPTSVANVMTSLGVDPAATPGTVLEGTGYCWSGQCLPGLTLDELAEIATAKTGREVTVLRDLSIEQFREHMRRSNDLDRRYIVNFLRGPLFRQGGGHHSPIGGYLEHEDAVLVLDVNAEFKPWLVSTERLFAAVNTIDSSTDLNRGMLLIQ